MVTNILPSTGLNISLSVHNTVEELRDVIKGVLPVVDASQGVTITIGDYDDDPRELWQIPEVQGFSRTLVSEGFLGILKCPELGSKVIKLGPCWGGLAVFLVSRGIPLTTIVDQVLMKEYVSAVQVGNKVIQDLYGCLRVGESSPMCPEHSQWNDFIDRLAGPEGCNFQRAVPDDLNSLTWTCDPNEDYPLSRRILADIGLSSAEIEASLSYFVEHGGCCDCEVVLNVGLREDDTDTGRTAISDVKL
jgi:hypothetical protein